MSVKNKIYIVFLLTMGVFGVSSFYFSNLIKNNAFEFVISDFDYPVPPQNIISEVDMSSAKMINRAARKASMIEPNLEGDFSSGLTVDLMNNLNPSSSTSFSQIKNSRISKRKNKIDVTSYHSSATSFQSVTDGSSGSKSSKLIVDTSVSGLRSSLGEISNPFAAPRSTGNDVILVDPGALGVDESQRIPVGDGLWVMLLMGLIYFVIPYFKSK